MKDITNLEFFNYYILMNNVYGLTDDEVIEIVYESFND